MSQHPESGFSKKNLTHSELDFSRSQRTGIEEVVFGGQKSSAEVCEIVEHQLAVLKKVLCTRLTAEHCSAVAQRFPELQLHPRSGIAHSSLPVLQGQGLGRVGVVSAGTSDGAVAEEAEVVARYLGCQTERINDVGVAGIERILRRVPDLKKMDAIIVVAGMEGALPGVVAGLVPTPVVAVPTSVGYGANFQGLSALLGMLVSCSPGMSVVNIDNGFGAAVVAARWLRHLRRKEIL